MSKSLSAAPLYAQATRAGDLLFVSGQLPVDLEGQMHVGLVGTEVSVDEAREAAALAARRCLMVVENELGSLDGLKGVVRIGGYVAAGEGFTDAPAVIDGASRAIHDALGERGHHARVALGVASLPAGACVEIEMTVRV